MKDKLERDISIYKGSDDGFSIEICKNCEPYEIQDEDVLILEVLDYRNNNQIVISKSVTGSNYISFTPSDTENLDIGYYRYNVKLKESSTGLILEIISPSTFWINLNIFSRVTKEFNF